MEGTIVRCHIHERATHTVDEVEAETESKEEMECGECGDVLCPRGTSVDSISDSDGPLNFGRKDMQCGRTHCRTRLRLDICCISTSICSSDPVSELLHNKQGTLSIHYSR
jgi:hypothetical protein